MIHRVEVGDHHLRIVLDAAALAVALGIEPGPQGKLDDPVVEQAFAARRRGRDRKLVFTSTANEREPDPTLIAAIARARRWFALLKDRKVESIADLAARTNLNRGWISSQLPLAFLAPDLVTAIVDGAHSPTINLDRLLAIASSPDWAAQ